MIRLESIGILFAALALATAAALANPAPGNDGGDREKDRNERGGALDTVSVRAIDISDRNRQIALTAVIVVTPTSKVLGYDLDLGAERVDENRVNLGGLPLVGGLFGDEEDEDGAAGPVRLVGQAYYLGTSLAVDLRETRAETVSDSPGPDLAALSAAIDDALAGGPREPLVYDWQDLVVIDGVRLLNRDFSYRMSGQSFVHIGGLTGDAVVTGSDAVVTGPDSVPVIGDIPLMRGLFGPPAGSAYLEGRNLVVVIKPSILEDDYED